MQAKGDLVSGNAMLKGCCDPAVGIGLWPITPGTNMHAAAVFRVRQHRGDDGRRIQMFHGRSTWLMSHCHQMYPSIGNKCSTHCSSHMQANVVRECIPPLHPFCVLNTEYKLLMIVRKAESEAETGTLCSAWHRLKAQAHAV